MVHKTTHFETRHALNRIEGQIRGIQSMIQDRKYCIDILTQIQAAQKALGRVSREILKKHMHHCVKDSLTTDKKDSPDKKINEIISFLEKI